MSQQPGSSSRRVARRCGRPQLDQRPRTHRAGVWTRCRRVRLERRHDIDDAPACAARGAEPWRVSFQASRPSPTAPPPTRKFAVQSSMASTFSGSSLANLERLCTSRVNHWGHVGAIGRGGGARRCCRSRRDEILSVAQPLEGEPLHRALEPFQAIGEPVEPVRSPPCGRTCQRISAMSGQFRASLYSAGLTIVAMLWPWSAQLARRTCAPP